MFNRTPMPAYEPLSANDIAQVILDFLEEYDPSLFEQVFEMQEYTVLIGTSFWTLIQTADNYLVSKKNPEAYKVFRQMENELGAGENMLPESPNESYRYNDLFFMFTVGMRPNLTAKDRKAIYRLSESDLENDSTVILASEAFNSFVYDCVVQLQRYELKLLKSVPSDVIEEEISQNEKLLNIYLKYRPEFIPYLNDK